MYYSVYSSIEHILHQSIFFQTLFLEVWSRVAWIDGSPRCCFQKEAVELVDDTRDDSIEDSTSKLDWLNNNLLDVRSGQTN